MDMEKYIIIKMNMLSSSYSFLSYFIQNTLIIRLCHLLLIAIHSTCTFTSITYVGSISIPESTLKVMRSINVP